jgi:biotin carboxylase
MSRVLLLIPSRTYRTRDFMEAARVLSVDVVVASPHRPALAPLMAGRHLRLDFNKIEESVRAIVDFASRLSLDAVVAVDDAGTRLASAAGDALGLPHNPIEAVETASNKALARAAFERAGLRTPAFRVFSVGQDPRAIAPEIRYPCVVKPLDLSGSQGVIRVEDDVSLPAVFERVAAIVRSCAREARPHLLIEDFIPGREVAVEGLLRGGQLEVLAIFDKPDPLDGPYFEETLYVTPSRLEPQQQQSIVETTAAATGALGLLEGPIHAELRIDQGCMTVLEVAPRSIGGLCARTLRFGAGMSLEELILRHAAGLPMPDHKLDTRAAGVMMLPIPRAGRLESVNGQEAARRVPEIEDLVVTVPPGERLVPLPEGDRYLGFLFARGRQPSTVEAALRDAYSRLTVVTHD